MARQREEPPAGPRKPAGAVLRSATSIGSSAVAHTYTSSSAAAAHPYTSSSAATFASAKAAFASTTAYSTTSVGFAPGSSSGFIPSPSARWDAGIGVRGSPISPSTPTSTDFMLQSSGGFMSYLHSQPSLPQNAHFVGTPSHFAPLNEPQPLDGKQASPSNAENKYVQVESDDGHEDARIDKRMLWTQDKDVRVMSAWLKHSIDPIHGNDKKGEKYWADVVKEYNLTTEKRRWRNKKQVKERWHKINRWTNAFHDAWVKVRKIYTSGYSDQMWIDKAHKMYEEDNKGARFVLMDVWYIVREEAKWIAYNNKKPNKRKAVDTGEVERDIFEDVELLRAIGQKAAKKAAHDAKGKSKESAIDVDLDRFEKIQSDSNSNRIKLLEMQQKLSADKLESSKIALLAAKDHKDAKLYEKESKMLETYRCLLTQDTSGMAEDIRAEHVAALKCLRMKLFPELP